jgi:hypothetical protein
MKTIDITNELKEISNRGRVAFAICCLESAINVSRPDQKKWQPVFDELWKFCSSDMAVWKERFSEVQKLYDETDPVILDIIRLIYDIGTTNINVTIRNEALKLATIPYLQSLSELMTINKFPLPDIRLFKKFPITDNRGWGWTFIREDVFKKES